MVDETKGQSKLGRGAVWAVVVALFAFGLVVPALVLALNGANQASVVEGVHLNAEQQQGRELFSHSCSLCHTLAATNSVGRTGPSLDIRLEAIPTVAARKALVLNAIAEGRARGLGQMPEMLYQGHEAEAIADFVSAVAGH
jgi:mono/diheme cytochrome c family protein